MAWSGARDFAADIKIDAFWNWISNWRRRRRRRPNNSPNLARAPIHHVQGPNIPFRNPSLRCRRVWCKPTCTHDPMIASICEVPKCIFSPEICINLYKHRYTAITNIEVMDSLNGIFGPCTWWIRALARLGEFLGRRRRRRRRHLEVQVDIQARKLYLGFPNWILTDMRALRILGPGFYTEFPAESI